jgi:hypothetical protein
MAREMFFLLEASRTNLYKNRDGSYNNSRILQQRRIKENNYQNDSEENPYMYIIRKLEKLPGTRIEPRDLAYLKDLGKYPVNRMFILRRWDMDNIRGPHADLMNDPYYKQKEPISKVIGWVDEDSDFFNIQISEGWTVINDLFHTLVGKILDEEFKQVGANIAPIPGWSQGMLVKLLTGVDGKELSANEIANYFRNPNVLTEGATRSGWEKDEGMSLKSTTSIDLKVVYEAKYIYDIDPVDAMQNIINNLLSMGSSPETIFEIGAFNDAASSLYATSPENGWNTVKNLVIDFIKKVTNYIIGEVNEAKENVSNEVNNNSDSITDAIFNELKKTIQSALSLIYATTVAKYRFAFKGAYGIHTGNNTTPWHLTIGNPLSPILSMNHIIVNNISIKGLKELTYNDIPDVVEATISVSFARNLGTDKISQMFFKNYSRTYSNGEIIKNTLNNQRTQATVVTVLWDDVSDNDKRDANTVGNDALRIQEEKKNDE